MYWPWAGMEGEPLGSPSIGGVGPPGELRRG
jgi:hypothetical protein